MRKVYKKFKKICGQITERIIPVILLVIILNWCFPHLGFAQTTEIERDLMEAQLPLVAGRQEILINNPAFEIEIIGELPAVQDKQPKMTVRIWATAYNSLPAQTDASPCITASGLNVCERDTEDIIATNFKYLPFGTKVRLPELFGDRVFTIHDRMNQRYYQTIDVWMKDYQTARQFGRKYTVMEIY